MCAVLSRPRPSNSREIHLPKRLELSLRSVRALPKPSRMGFVWSTCDSMPIVGVASPPSPELMTTDRPAR